MGELKPLGLAAFLGRPTAALLQNSIDGNSIGDVEIHLADFSLAQAGESGARVFGIIRLRNAFVQSFEITSTANDLPWYQIKLIYAALEITNIHRDPSGEINDREHNFTWNKVTNTGRLSIISHTDFEDTDGDGMSDEYETAYFGSATGGNPNDDSDHDGESDLAEFLAMTDPQDPASVFSATLEEGDGDAMVICVKTEPGRFYQLRSSDNLGVFFLIGDAAGDGSVVEFVDSNAGNRRFYQVTIRYAN